MSVRTVIADDQAWVRAGVRMIPEVEDDPEVADSDEAVAAVRQVSA